MIMQAPLYGGEIRLTTGTIPQTWQTLGRSVKPVPHAGFVCLCLVQVWHEAAKKADAVVTGTFILPGFIKYLL